MSIAPTTPVCRPSHRAYFQEFLIRGTPNFVASAPGDVMANIYHDSYLLLNSLSDLVWRSNIPGSQHIWDRLGELLSPVIHGSEVSAPTTSWRFEHP